MIPGRTDVFVPQIGRTICPSSRGPLQHETHAIYCIVKVQTKNHVNDYKVMYVCLIIKLCRRLSRGTLNRSCKWYGQYSDATTKLNEAKRPEFWHELAIGAEAVFAKAVTATAILHSTRFQIPLPAWILTSLDALIIASYVAQGYLCFTITFTLV